MWLYVLYGVLAIIALLFIIALFTAKSYSIHKSVTINKSDSKVYDYLKQLNNQRAFNEWLRKDPNIKIIANNKNGQVGAISYYEGNKKTGAGEQEIIALQENKKIDIELRCLKPFKSISRTPFELTALSPDQTLVKWTMEGRMNYPMNSLLLFVNIDKFLGRDIEKSLGTLKQNLES